jgi:hypothetical protein
MYSGLILMETSVAKGEYSARVFHMLKGVQISSPSV